MCVTGSPVRACVYSAVESAAKMAGELPGTWVGVCACAHKEGVRMCARYNAP